MDATKKRYERPEIVTYSASQVLSMLGPAKTIYGGGGGLTFSPEAMAGGGSSGGPRDLGSI